MEVTAWPWKRGFEWLGKGVKNEREVTNNDQMAPKGHPKVAKGGPKGAQNGTKIIKTWFQKTIEKRPPASKAKGASKAPKGSRN